MKLAEALIMRKDLQTRLMHLQSRIKDNLVVQDGEAPSEDPAQLIKTLENTQNRFTTLVQAINRTNVKTVFDERRSLADALAERDGYLEKRNAYASVAKHATVTQDRYSKSEIRKVSLLSATDTQQQADLWAMRFRQLDLLIQAKNWQTDLIENR